jgi:CBS domain-containing protein
MNGRTMDTKVWEILNRKGRGVYSTSPESTVFEAISTMSEHGIGALMVVTHDRPVGIVTERDYLRKIIIKNRSSRDTPVADIMTDNVIYVDPRQTVRDCMTMMSDIRCRHLPVLGDDGYLEGLISMGDCARQLTLDQDAEIRHLRDYINGRYPG